MKDALSSAIEDFTQKFLAFDIDAMPEAAGALKQAGCGVPDFLAACMPCMEEIGKKFEAGEYYLPQLVVAGEMFKTAGRIIRDSTKKQAEVSYVGRLVLGTPRGDIHDLGKDIFAVLAEASGFAVTNLGVDVEPGKIVDAVEKSGAPILGLSCLLTTTYGSVREVIGLLEEKGLRERTRVIIGGGATEKSLVQKLGVDAQTRDAYEGITIIKSWAGSKAKEAAA